MKSLVIFEVKFCVLCHFWSLMLLSSELILFWSYFLELMVESGYWTWFRAKNPIDEELRRKNLVWFNFPGSQNLKLNLCVFFLVLFRLEHYDTHHPQETTTETEDDETSPSTPSVFHCLFFYCVLFYYVFFCYVFFLCTFCHVFFIMWFLIISYFIMRRFHVCCLWCVFLFCIALSGAVLLCAE